ncbi:MupG family TIM beta-alpha barrel fold protein [Spiroplasma chrysopicola]|uniref:Outer surface protein n=1 Tax=Spiroplasma chrysopicola DF-1 TaxID=1276227 RepID=R4U413_9MOLU|nr:MupG family TIM beta-alpha barrel fold protein [Spiroplasma chrysopicola]AGM25288.1 hypothetical protein SCHRY_v1c07120 [Spiroplasma chrysopicola DF-1]
MLGVSIYTTGEMSLAENQVYLKTAQGAGFNYVFCSGHLVERQNETELATLISYAQKLGMYVCLDLSKKYFDQAKIMTWKPDAIRLDFGFSLDEVITIIDTLPFDIQINGSDNSLEDIIEIIKLRGSSRLSVSYNFYPKPYTGMDEGTLIYRNRIIKEYGIKTNAFIASQTHPRKPVFQGLPTVEKMRFLEPYVQLQWYKKHNIDTCIIGDLNVSEEELKFLTKINKSDDITIKLDYANLPKEIIAKLKNQRYHLREDSNSYVLRFLESRGLEQNNSPVVPFQNEISGEVKPYTLLIDNEKYHRYNGEIYLTKLPIKIDEKTNYLANLEKEGILIKLLKPGQPIAFV